MFIDPPTHTSTDVNEAWKASFDRVDKNKNAIAECGWGPCNRNPCLYKEIQNTMSSNDCDAFKLLKRNFMTPTQHYSFQPSFDSVFIQQSQSTNINDLTDPTQQNATTTTVVQIKTTFSH